VDFVGKVKLLQCDVDLDYIGAAHAVEFDHRSLRVLLSPMVSGSHGGARQGRQPSEVVHAA
jgi:hypothetical protein